MLRPCACLLVAVASASADLHQLVAQDSAAGIAAALDGGAPINAIGQGGQTPLMAAVLMGKEAAVETLLARGADTSIGEKDGYTPCHGAGFQGRSKIMSMLIDHGLPCTTDTHRDGYTPLHRACWGREQRHTETARVLLKAGAPPDQPGPQGKSPSEMTSNSATLKMLQHRLLKKEKAGADGKEL